MQAAATYITIDQWQAAGLSYDQYKWDKRVGKLQTETKRSCRGKKVKILLESIQDDAKRQAILDKFKAPEKEARYTTFIERIVLDPEAQAFFADKNKACDAKGNELPVAKQKTYVLNASIFNLLETIYAEQEAERKRFGTSMRGFWHEAAETLTAIQNEVPHTIGCKNHVSLKRAYEQYLDRSYSYFLKGWGNTNAQLITDEIEDWYVNEMSQNRLSANMTYFKYLEEAPKRGWSLKITSSAFEARMAEERNRTKIQMARWGTKTHRNKKGQTFKLRKAEYSNDLWVGDGTSWNWYYNQDGKPAMATTYFVMDSLSRKMLGWATLAGINKENMHLQLEAYRQALRNSGAKPYQLKYDNQGGHKGTTAADFYSRLATVHFPTRAYRPSGKRIEPTFKDFQTVKLAEMPFWTGFNRKSHANPDYAPDMENITKYVHLLPNYEQLLQLIDIAIGEWNNLNYNGKGSPNEIYERNRRADEKPVTLDELAELFWDIQGPKKYHPVGISLRYKGEDLLYEVYTDKGDVDYTFRKNYLNQKFYIKYDPDGEYPDIDLLQIHPTGGYQTIATASPKRSVSESVRGLKDGERDWIDRQMKMEDNYYAELQAELESIGYSDEQKFSRWMDKLNPQPSQQQATTPSLYGDDEDENQPMTIIQ